MKEPNEEWNNVTISKKIEGIHKHTNLKSIEKREPITSNVVMEILC